MTYENGRWSPNHATKQEFPDVGLTVYLYETDKGLGKFVALTYLGKATKSYFHTAYLTAERRTQAVQDVVNALRDQKRRKAEQKKAEAAFVHGYQVGDIVYNSWGYDQTNVDFYQVVALRGKKQIVLREIASQVSETGFMSGRARPVPDKFMGPEIVKNVSSPYKEGKGYISFEHGSCTEYTGSSAFCSWYA